MTSEIPEAALVTSSGQLNISGPVGALTSRLAGAPNKEFKAAHVNSDVDAEPFSQHHTLGYGPNQALPGTSFKRLQDQITAAVAALIVVGKTELWLGGDVPNGFMLLKGATISRTTYSELFAVWGTKYGVGDSSTTFGTPDTRFRELIGTDTLANIGTSDAIVLGSRLTSRLHSHTHNVASMNTVAYLLGATGNSSVSHTHSGVTSLDGSHTHGILDGGDHNHGGSTGSTSLNQTSNTPNTGGNSRLTGPDSHSHSVTTGGSHNHGGLVTATTNHQHTTGTTGISSTDHNHTIASHDHVINAHNTNTGTMATDQHPYMYVGVIVRYTTDLDAPGVS